MSSVESEAADDEVAWMYDQAMYANFLIQATAAQQEGHAEDFLMGLAGALTRFLMDTRKDGVRVPEAINAWTQGMHDLAKQITPEDYPQ